MPQPETNAKVGKAKRLTTRLAIMSAHEIAYRVRDLGYSEMERIGWNSDPKRSGEPSFKSYLAGVPASRFYPGHLASARILVQTHFPEWIERAVQDANTHCRHKIELLNFGTLELGRGIDWHRDPVTGQTWERIFWADYSLENGLAGRDPKVIFELNRHQHLPRLSKAYHLTGDERYAKEVVEQLLSWIRQNPPGIGINWQSSLEIALRSLSWLWALFLILPSKSLNDSAAQCIGDSLFAQLEHVHRHLSLYNSPNTHLIGEAAALFIAGLVFRDLKPGRKWMETGAALLATEAEKQILSDGVYGELSSYYHCYAIDFYLQALVLAEHNAFEFPPAIRLKVAGMLDFLMHVTRPDGSIPLLGDDDGGRALGLDRRNYRSSRDLLCLGAVLFQRKDFKHQSGDFAQEALWLLGEEAWNLYRRLGSEAPARRDLLCPSAGYLVQRSGWGPLDSHLVFDFGGLGILTGGHAHADALSFTLFSGGRELLADSGTFAYNGAPEWREYFRSTRAHNTVTVDGRNQAEMGTTFGWKTKMFSSGSEIRGLPVRYFEAEHDGYRGTNGGVTHRRRLVHIADEYWIVADDFRGAGEHTFAFNFHFGPEVDVLIEHRGPDVIARAQDAEFLLTLFASGPVSAELVRGQTEPVQGWASQGYGEKKPAQSLCARLVAPANSSAVALLAAGAHIPSVRRLDVDAGDAIAFSCQSGAFDDITILSTGNDEIQVAGLRMRGEFLSLRMEGALVRKVAAVRTTSLYLGATNLLEDAVCAQSAA